MRFKSIFPSGGQPTPIEGHSTSQRVWSRRASFSSHSLHRCFLKIVNHILQYSGLRAASSHFLISGFPRPRAFPRSQSYLFTDRGDDGSHSRWVPPGEGRIPAAEIHSLFLKPCFRKLGTFPKMAWTHLLTGFLKPYVPFLYPCHGHRPECRAAIVAHLNQFPMCLSSGPSQGGDQAPSSTLQAGLLPT